jgi:hypothetical protein
MVTRPVESWQTLQLQDLFFAFRKAKADCYFERSICIAREFCEYESDLPLQLATLLSRLKAGEVTGLLAENLGTTRLVAKKLGVEPRERPDGMPSEGHSFFSDPLRAFERLCETHLLTPEFRIVGAFPVSMHVMSALWINLVGHKFDAVLSKAAYGSRLRRYRRDPGMSIDSVGAYHIEAIGSFQPYFGPYRRWREDGLNAIRNELQSDRSVVAISMDFTSYYHQIDPSFIADARFLTEAGIVLTPWEFQFTAAFTEALCAWSTTVVKKLMEFGCSQDDVKMALLTFEWV